MSDKETWSVYLVRCADASFYTGIAKDVDARVANHNAGTGAKYTQTRRPVELVYTEEVGAQGDAMRREIQVKKLPREEKAALAQGAASVTTERRSK